MKMFFSGTRETVATSYETPVTDSVAALQSEIERVIKGKTEAVRLTLVALLAGGHLLLEDVPGVGKTTLAQALARAVEGTFHRIQFTSDLLPSDVLGLSIYNQKTGVFEWKHGPIFANVVLADEINRTTPKTQSALLEAMAERQITAEGVTRQLPAPFIVLATQNPVEHHGTYPLPESQTDRFLLRLRLGYPAPADEKLILRERTHAQPLDEVRPVVTATEVAELQEQVKQVRVDEALMDYLLAIVTATRNSEMLDLGVSPRGTLALFRAAQALAFIEGRMFCIADDIKRLVVPVCAHRIVVSSRFSSSMKRTEETETVLRELLKTVNVPL